MREAAPAPVTAPAQPQLQPQPQSFLQVVELFEKHHEALLRAQLWAHVHLVRFEQGRIELRPSDAAPRDLPNKLGTLLSQWTGQRWVVTVSSELGEPGARIERVRETEPAAAAPPTDADELPEGDESL
jgi:DNA polymerase-3 subunit gamma/tau